MMAVLPLSATAQQPQAPFAPPAPPRVGAAEGGGNPFVGTLGPGQDFFFQLINRFEGLQGQIVQVNRQVLRLQESIGDLDSRMDSMSGDQVGGTGSPILDSLADLEQQEELSAQLRDTLRDSDFVMCVNDQAMFRSPDGARFMIPAINATDNDTFRLYGGCG